jgi:hypothetical protein
MPNAWQVFQKYMGGKGLSSKEMSAMYKDAGVKQRFKSLVDAEQGTTEHIASILHDRDAGLHLPSPSVPATPEAKMDTPDDLGGWQTVLRGLSERSSLKTLKDLAVNTGIALALKGIYEGGDAGAGLAHMTKFVTSAEATELSIAVAETFSMPALVLATPSLSAFIFICATILFNGRIYFFTDFHKSARRIFTFISPSSSSLLQSFSRGGLSMVCRKICLVCRCLERLNVSA